MLEGFLNNLRAQVHGGVQIIDRGGELAAFPVVPTEREWIERNDAEVIDFSKKPDPVIEVVREEPTRSALDELAARGGLRVERP